MLGRLIEPNSEIILLRRDICIAWVNIAFFARAKIRNQYRHSLMTMIFKSICTQWNTV